jgi:hypothetical protein
MPKWSWSYEALQYQADKGSGAIMACSSMAVLPCVQNDVDGLIIITSTDPEFERKLDAIHEAGHCVFALLLGLHVKNITIKTKTEDASCNLTKISDLNTLLFRDIGRKFYAAGMAVTKKYYPEAVTFPDYCDLKVLYYLGGISESHKKQLKEKFKSHNLKNIQIEKISTEFLREDLQKYFRQNLADPKILVKIETLSRALLDKEKLTASEIRLILSNDSQNR